MTDTADLTRLAEGKTKVIWQDPNVPGQVLIESKDDITAGDGASHDVLEGKAVAATTTTCNVFELLAEKDIPTHYLGRADDRTFRALRAEMIPLELVVRRIATGSYLKRNPEAVEGEVFDPVVFEIFHKDDPNHDPILGFQFSTGTAIRYPASAPLTDREAIDTIPLDALGLGDDPETACVDLRRISVGVFETIEAAWREQDVQLVDLKIECGWTDAGNLVVADVVDNDSWRIWPAGDKAAMLDKQVYRELANVDDPKARAKELGQIKKNYAKVAEDTGKFVT